MAATRGGARSMGLRATPARGMVLAWSASRLSLGTVAPGEGELLAARERSGNAVHSSLAQDYVDNRHLDGRDGRIGNRCRQQREPDLCQTDLRVVLRRLDGY